MLLLLLLLDATIKKFSLTTCRHLPSTPPTSTLYLNFLFAFWYRRPDRRTSKPTEHTHQNATNEARANWIVNSLERLHREDWFLTWLFVSDVASYPNDCVRFSPTHELSLTHTCFPCVSRIHTGSGTLSSFRVHMHTHVHMHMCSRETRTQREDEANNGYIGVEKMLLWKRPIFLLQLSSVTSHPASRFLMIAGESLFRYSMCVCTCLHVCGKWIHKRTNVTAYAYKYGRFADVDIRSHSVRSCVYVRGVFTDAWFIYIGICTISRQRSFTIKHNRNTFVYSHYVLLLFLSHSFVFNLSSCDWSHIYLYI